MPLPATFADLQEGGAVMIYLPRHAYRAERSLAWLSDIGFRGVQLVAGADGHVDDTHALAAKEGWTIDPGLAPGKAGCALTMLRAWRRLAEGTEAYTLLFEDDVLPHPLIPHLGPAFWSDTPKDADWVMLGNQMDVPNDDARCVVSYPAFCAHAMVITREGATAALEAFERRGPDVPIGPLDCELRTWMCAEAVRYACWNGTRLPRVFPTSEQVGPDHASWPPDIAWAGRDTGVFYQNYALGSTIHGLDATFA